MYITKHIFSKYNTVIFDLSGVLIDFGVRIPYIAMHNALYMNKINFQDRIINHGIGRNDEQHIKALCLMNNNKYKKVLQDYNKLLINLNNNPYYNYPIKGSVELTNKFKNMGYNIGIITNYNNNITSIINNKLYNWGYKYDYIINNQRPSPDMINNILNHFNTQPDSCLKIGESYLNLYEGHTANIDTINIIDSSRDMGLEEIEFDDMCDTIKNNKRINIINHLYNYPQPKYMIDSINTINLII